MALQEIRPAEGNRDEIAVVGMACRLPGAGDPAAFWRLLSAGGHAIGPVPDGRWPDEHQFDLDSRPGVRLGGFLDDVAGFDAAFFGISPREAAFLDPQQRLALELAWEALENASVVPGSAGLPHTSVFLGAMSDDYARLLHRTDGVDAGHYALTGTHRGALANRVSYCLGLEGTSLTVDCGQSSSLVSVQLACENLIRSDAEIALAGGVDLNLLAHSAVGVADFGALSPDGRCYTFDARANGYVRGEGGAVVVLKRLADALRDGDHVHCVIRGGAINNDGGGTSYTAPDRAAQARLLRAAFANAMVDPATAAFVELHGTGTPVGDPVEAAALGEVLGTARGREAPLRVGSAKTNVGHLEGAAGIVGFVKAALALEHGEFPASLNFSSVNPAIDLDRLNLRVQQDRGALPGDGRDRVGGVSSFGMGGTNCHVVLSAPPERSREAHRAPTRLDTVPVVLSARSAGALRAQAEAMTAVTGDETGIAAALVTGRSAFEHRAVLTVHKGQSWAGPLGALAEGRDHPHVVTGETGEGGSVAFMFSGQGAQRPGMAAALCRAVPAFAEAFDEIAAQFAPLLSRPLAEIVFDAEADLLDRTEFTQPALFAVEVAVARTLERHGVRADFLIGHSIGEIAAAHFAGVLSLADACALVAARGRLMQGLPRESRSESVVGGAMVAVQASEDEVLAALEPGAEIAAVNAADSVVVSGDEAAVLAVAAGFTERGRKTSRLRVSHAFHSAHLDGMLGEFEEIASRMRFAEPRIPIVSNLSGRVAGPGELGSARYWARHVREAVRFRDGLLALAGAGVTTFVEVGPGAALAGLVTDGLRVPLLRERGNETESYVRGLAQLHVAGHDVAWGELLGTARLPLPTYPFQRTPHWITGSGAPRLTARRQEAVESTKDESGPGGGAALGREQVAYVLGHVDTAMVDERRSFKDLGFDSLSAVELRTRLAKAIGHDLPATLLFDHPTPRRVIAFVSDVVAGRSEHADRPVARTVSGDEPIAVVGMACRLPGGVWTPEALWDLIDEGRDAIGPFPADRGWTVSGSGGFIEGVADFDAEFFGISPREALAMDPQQRLLLECSWEALEHAGIDPASLAETGTGVFTGVSGQDYLAPLDEVEQARGHALTGGAASVASGRVAYALGLEGPAVSVDTACSSSLVALHLATQSLRRGECSLALAGGAAVMSTPGMFAEFAKQGGLSEDSRCKAFAEGADGTAWGEGAGVLVVERLSDARRNGHRVLAVVRGSAVNSDGASNGLTAPNGPSQQRVIRAALADAGLSTVDVDAVEAHGTGTKLGDPIEAQALLATYGQDRERPLLLGSVKSNIGHAQAAAGVAGVIKMVESLRRGVLPATLHVDAPSSHVDWASGAVELLTSSREWPDAGRPRRAGVSAFGISGTNAHVVLEQAPEDVSADVPEAVEPDPVVAWVLSGRGAGSTARQAARLAAVAPEVSTVDAAGTLVTGRAALDERAVVVGNRAGLLAGLDALARSEPAENVVTGTAGAGAGVVFVFPGQGSQWVGMGRELLRSSPVFADAMTECEFVLSGLVDWSLSEVLDAEDPAVLDRVDVVQPVLCAVMISLARLWDSVGVRPDVVVGHSQGEIAAACVAGILTLDDALRIAVTRSALITRLAGAGGMLWVATGPGAVAPVVSGGVSVAAVNGPASVVLSGVTEELDKAEAWCGEQGWRTRRVPVDYASHSAQVDSLQTDLRAELADLAPKSGTITFYSTVDGRVLDGTELDGLYWYRNLREQVGFSDAIEALTGQGYGTFVEISPHPVLTVDIATHAETTGATVAPTLRREDGGWDRFLLSAAQTWVTGAAVTWPGTVAGARPVTLPTYAFARERYWLPDDARAARKVADPEEGRFWDVVGKRDVDGFADLLGVDTARTPGALEPALTALSAWHGRRHEGRLADESAYQVRWVPVTVPPGANPGLWVLVAGSGCPEEALTALGEEIRDRGGEVVTVHIGGDREELAHRLTESVAGRGADGVAAFLGWGEETGSDALWELVVLTQGTADAGVEAPLWCVTTGAVSTGDEDTVRSPVSAGLWGLGRAAGLETGDRWGGLVDLPGASAASTLADVLTGTGPEREIAVRGTAPLARRLARATATGGDSGERADLTGGTVLVTGGTGALGTRIVRWLVEQGAAKVVVASRGGSALAELGAWAAERGALVESAACDVSDARAVANLVNGLTSLRGVVHAAGVVGDGVLGGLDRERFDAVCAPKISGAWNLHDATRDLDLAFFLMFSSVSGVWGSGGQGVYPGANGFLDGLASYRRGLGLAASSVAWGPWAGGGMAADEHAARHFDRHGLAPIDPEVALAALGRALAAGRVNTVVASVDWSLLAPVFDAAGLARLFADLPEARAVLAERRDEEAGGLAQRIDGLPAAERERVVAELVLDQVAGVLGHRDPGALDRARPFSDLGFDSLMVVELRNRLAAATAMTFSATVAYEHPTPAAVVEHVLGRLDGNAHAPAVVVHNESGTDDDPVVIVGMACRYPGGITSPESLWEFIDGGGDGISAYPADRGWAPSPGGTGGFLDGAGDFDAAFFGISPREALAMDPQQRLALECSWEALERAGLDPAALRGSDTGVFLGLSHQDYGLRLHESGSDDTVEGYVMTGNSASVGSGRIAYALGLEGPAVSVDTACSSSLVALHWAARSLRSGECTLAVTGGVTVMATPGLFAEFERQGGLAGDGRCKAFSAAADGTGLAEGVGVLVLQRRSDALREGRRVLATVRGSAINSDGASNGLSAPNGRAQQRVIAKALADARLSTVDVDAVEAHGTGTKLGDPIEAHALLATYGQDRDRPLLLGSVKSNIGHTQAAAGVAGVIKMVEAMRRGALPATRHVDAPSEHIDWGSGSVELLTEPRAWPETARPRRAGVSSFGISGTNAHVILEQGEEPGAGQAVEPEGPVSWLVSARSEAALRERAAGLAEATGHVLDIGWSLARSRAGLACRAVVTGRDRAELAAGLRRLADGDAGAVRGEAVPGGADAVAVLFSGQGAQRAGMGARLYARFSLFASVLDDVCGRFELPKPLREVMFGEIEHENPLDQTEFTQPALFAFEVALYRLLESWGLRPQALAGHSIGELTAAYLAGVWSLDDACKLVAARGRLMQALPGNDTVSRSESVVGGGGRRVGAMVSLQASEAEVLPLLTDGVSIAAINAPDAVVVSGDADAVDEVTVTVGAWGRKVKQLRVSHAFHSPHMDGMLDEFATVAAELDYHAPRLPLVSGTTGEMATAEQLADPAYWVAHVRQAVRFADEVATLLRRGVTRFAEIGPDAVLAPAVHASLGEARATVTAMQRRNTEQDATLLDGLGKLYTAGVDLEWDAVFADFFPGHEPRPVDLPTYPFQHERFWITTTGVGASEKDGSVFGVDWVPVEPKGSTVQDVTVLRPAADPVSVLGALQRFLADPGRDGSTLVVFTDGAVAAVDGDRVPAPEQAPISGLVRSAQTEYPGRIVLVDGDPDLVDAAAAAALGEPQLAWRDGGWLAPRLTEIPEPAQRAGSPWEQGGTVLVTGGTGALGKEIARHLATAHGVRRLVLSSRRGMTADGAGELVRELGELGCAAEVVAADVGNRAELARLLAGIPAEHPLTGVVHAAGVLDDGVLASLTPARIARVLHAKADAARYLDELTRALPVSNFVLLSGFIGLLGGAGQAAYAAANAQLDAVAAHRRANGLPGVSLAWGLWNAEGSMAAGLDAQALRRLARYGIVPMSSETSLALFDRCFNAEAALLVPAKLDLGAPDLDPPALYRALPVPARTGSVASTEDQEPRLRAKLAAIAPAEHRRFLLGYVRAEAAAVLGHASADGIDARTGFLEQGFDSLTGVELRNRLIAATGETLPSTLIFDYPSPSDMADYLARELAEPVRGFGDLEDNLDEIIADPDLRQEAAGRLRRMLARIEGHAKGADIVVGFEEQLGEADDEDLFDLIDNELGV